jgi:hypothetical protein
MNINPTPYVLGPEEGEAFWGFGALWTLKASAEQTGDSFSLIEEVAPGGRHTASRPSGGRRDILRP